MMRRQIRFRIVLAAVAAAALCRLPAAAQSAASPSNAEAKVARRDGSHDFDPLVGTWKYHLKRLLNPLTGSTKWVELDGTGVCVKVWESGANLDKFTMDGSSGHLEGLTLRLYRPESHQWTLYWANRKDGVLVEPQIGEFKDGRGEFYAQDTLNGKSILIRFVWTNMATVPHFEQAFSQDGGKTWEVNWITDQTRITDTTDPKR